MLQMAVAKSYFDLSSDHSPVLITLKAHALNQKIQPSLSKTYRRGAFLKRKQLEITLTKMYWILGCKTKLSTSNKLLIITILKGIWTYRIQLWGMASTSNIEILEWFQLKTLHDSRHILVCAKYGYPKGSLNTNS
jgi:hypothetical protein